MTLDVIEEHVRYQLYLQKLSQNYNILKLLFLWTTFVLVLVKGEKRKWTNSECEEPTFEDSTEIILPGSNIHTHNRNFNLFIQ